MLLGAVGAKAGTAQWAAGDDPARGYDARPLCPDGRDHFGHNVERTVEIAVFGIDDLLREESRWDLLHVDVQGDEVEVCEAGLDEMNARAAWIVIGTHSRLIEGQLLELFRSAGWILEHEKPTHFAFHAGASCLEAMTTIDGIQVWRNPRNARS